MEYLEIDDDVLMTNLNNEITDHFIIDDVYETSNDSQCSSFLNINLDNLNDDDIFTDDNDCNSLLSFDYPQEDISAFQKTFIEYIKNEELMKFNESYVEKYFSTYNLSLYDVVKRSRTQLWLDNCIYGLQLQAYICMIKDIPLPIVAQRNRKYPIMPKNESKKKGITNDSILEYLLNQCKMKNEINELRNRDAPRNQIGLLIFLLDILNHPYYKICIKWENKIALTFKILNSKLVAYYWMIVKENDTCNFENFARGIRYLRHSGFFKQLDKKKQRTYQFNRKAIKEYRNKRSNNQLSNVLFYNLDNL